MHKWTSANPKVSFDITDAPLNICFVVSMPHDQIYRAFVSTTSESQQTRTNCFIQQEQSISPNRVNFLGEIQTTEISP